MREQFEKLPEIAERLHTVFYNEDLNQYHAAMINSALSVKYVQGAWYAFQEQKKQMDLIKKLAVGLRNEFNLWADDTESFDAIEAQIENLEAVLK